MISLNSSAGAFFARGPSGGGGTLCTPPCASPACTPSLLTLPWAATWCMASVRWMAARMARATTSSSSPSLPSPPLPMGNGMPASAAALETAATAVSDGRCGACGSPEASRAATVCACLASTDASNAAQFSLPVPPDVLFSPAAASAARRLAVYPALTTAAAASFSGFRVSLLTFRSFRATISLPATPACGGLATTMSVEVGGGETADESAGAS